MSFQQGLSGLNASAKSLDVIGNNVANTGTVGFKGAQAQFADVFAASMTGAGASQIGIGTRLATVAQQFSQGNISVTNNPLDVAVSGTGLFRMQDSAGAVTYTRNGQFQRDKNGYIIGNTGLYLTGWGVNSTGSIVATTPAPIQVSSAYLTPSATTSVSPGLNLDSGASVIDATYAVIPFSLVNPGSYNNSTSATVYDSLGNSHTLTTYFRKVGLNTWDVFAAFDGVAYDPNTVTAATTKIGQLVFGTNGVMDTAASSSTLAPTIPPQAIGTGAWVQNIRIFDTVANAAAANQTPALANGASTMSFGIDFAVSSTSPATTQYGSPFGVNSLTQDGFTSGRLAGFNVGKDGVIQGRYTNGQSKTLGQVVLSTFTNPQGLQQLGNNQWSESPESGQPLTGAPGTGSLGQLQSGATEDSNVDLTAELVNMITAQRVYQANAQTIKTQDQVLQTLVNLR